VYLVDNGSTDASVDFVTEHYPAVKVIQFERNLGFAEAYNRAVASVEEELVVFLNNDTEVEQGWLAELKSGLEIPTNRLAACGSKILFYHDRSLVNHAGGMLAPIGTGIDLDFMKPDKQDAYRQRFVGCVSGASMIMPRSVFLQLGGFDSDFFAYFEDVDICWRAWLAGYRVIFIPSSRIYHKLSATMGPFLRPERLFLGERNRMQCMLKNLEMRNLIAAAPVSCLYALYRLLVFLRSCKPMAALAILRGNWWVLKHLPMIIAKRRSVQHGRLVPDAFLAVHGLMASFTEGFREFARLAALRRT
jgi:GT2 family glycosyltransferase